MGVSLGIVAKRNASLPPLGLVGLVSLSAPRPGGKHDRLAKHDRTDVCHGRTDTTVRVSYQATPRGAP